MPSRVSLIKANPVVDYARRQEFPLGQAEDVIRYVGTMASPLGEEGGENPNDAFN